MAMRDEFREESLTAWKEGLEEIFPSGIPESKKWEDLRTMASVLTSIGVKQQSNHMFFPRGGGLDLLGANPYDEEAGCLALRTSNRLYEVVKPTALLFESFGSELEWAYFRIECEKMPFTEVAEDHEGDTEEVVLVRPGVYGTRSDWDSNTYAGKRLPDDAQLIVRLVGGGSLVVFAKASLYNVGRDASGRDAYDGRHNKMSAEQFRNYIARSANSE